MENRFFKWNGIENTDNNKNNNNIKSSPSGPDGTHKREIIYINLFWTAAKVITLIVFLSYSNFKMRYSLRHLVSHYRRHSEWICALSSSVLPKIIVRYSIESRLLVCIKKRARRTFQTSRPPSVHCTRYSYRKVYVRNRSFLGLIFGPKTPHRIDSSWGELVKSQKVLSQALVITNLPLGRYQKLLNGQVSSLNEREYLTELSGCLWFVPPPSLYVCVMCIYYELFAALHLIESFRISYFR